MHMRRGTFAIVVGLILAALAGATFGGRLGLQEVLVILGLIMAWAIGVSIFRGLRRLRKWMQPTRPKNEG